MTSMPKQTPSPPSYLQGERTVVDLAMTVDLESKEGKTRICETNMRNLYWSMG